MTMKMTVVYIWVSHTSLNGLSLSQMSSIYLYVKINKQQENFIKCG